MVPFLPVSNVYHTENGKTFVTFVRCSFQECLFRAATTEDPPCNFHDLLESAHIKMTKETICYMIVQTFHGKLQDLWQKIFLMTGMMNSVLNPVIYAFWYQQFRLRITQTWKNFFVKCLHMDK